MQWKRVQRLHDWTLVFLGRLLGFGIGSFLLELRRGQGRLRVGYGLSIRGVTRRVPVSNGYPLNWGKSTRVLAGIDSDFGREPIVISLCVGAGAPFRTWLRMYNTGAIGSYAMAKYCLERFGARYAWMYAPHLSILFEEGVCYA